MSANPRRRRRAGSLGVLKASLWAVIEYDLGLVEDDFVDHELRQKAANGLIQASLAYAKLLEQYDLAHEVQSLRELAARELATRHLRNGHPTA